MEGGGEGDAEADAADGEEGLTQTDTYADSVIVIIGGVIVVGMVLMGKSSLGAQTFLKMDVPWNIP